MIRGAGVALAWLAAGLALPYLIGTGPLVLGQLEFILVLIMVAVGLNIVLGLAGQLFLGPSALVATGGYAAAVVATQIPALQSLAAMCLVSVAAAVALAAVLAVPALRIGGFYLGTVTLFAALAIPDVAAHAELTGGAEGLSLLTDPTFVQTPDGVGLYHVGLLLVALLAGYSWLIERSRLGRSFTAIAASEDLAQSIGIRPYRTKLVAFMLSAVPCGIAGAYYVYSQQFISPDSVGVSMSIIVLAGLVIGGRRTIVGPVVGTALIGAASQFVGSFERYDGVVYGMALIVAAIGLPSGFMGLYRTIGMQLKDGSAAPEAAPGVSLELPPRSESADGGERYGREASSRGRVPSSDPLVVDGVTRRFGGVLALDNVDLAVEPGTVHALIGPNGSGKTSLLNLISGFYRVDSGTITLAGHPLHKLPACEISRLGIARTFQTPKLLGASTVMDNLVVAADHSTDKGSRRRAAWALEQVGLQASATTPVELLPHGMQRLLEVARALALGPAFVLLDEPAAGLSGSEVEHLRRAVDAMSSAGQGVLIVEHNLPVVLGLAVEVTVLHEGRVLARGAPSSVASDPEVARVYLARRASGDDGPRAPAGWERWRP